MRLAVRRLLVGVARRRDELGHAVALHEGDHTAAESGARYHRLEREYGTFRRVVLIPASVLAEQASATLENGILKVVLQKPPSRTRRVEVRNSGTEK